MQFNVRNANAVVSIRSIAKVLLILPMISIGEIADKKLFIK
jgi:hypothetical protein